MSVDVGPGVLGLAVLGEDGGDELVELGGELDQGVLGEVAEGELALAGVPGVGLAEDSVAVAGDDAARVEGGPEVGVDVLVCIAGRDGVLHLEDPAEDLLGGEATESQLAKRIKDIE